MNAGQLTISTVENIVGGNVMQPKIPAIHVEAGAPPAGGMTPDTTRTPTPYLTGKSRPVENGWLSVEVRVNPLFPPGWALIGCSDSYIAIRGLGNGATSE